VLDKATLQQVPAPKIAWWVEPESQMAKMPELSKSYEWYFCFSRHGLSLLQDAGIKHCSYLSHAVDRASFYPISGAPKRWDVAFVGKHSAHREAMIMAALSVTDRVAVYGPRWLGACLRNPKLLKAYRGSACYGAQLNYLYSSSKTVLNVIAHQQQGSISSGINMRPYEVLASGSLLISDEYQETESGLVSGENCVFYQSAEELKFQLQDLLANPKRLEGIANAGHRFLADQFSYDAMAKEILEKCALITAKA
jgi:spore maturation protein CgeB